MSDLSAAALPDPDSDFTRKLLARVGWRCVPILLIAYVIAYIDRVNVGFAAITATKTSACPTPCSALAPACSFSPT
jgi:hypothetical protein